MHCAHVRLGKGTVNTCRLCLSLTRTRIEIEIMGLSWSDEVCSKSDSRLRDDRGHTGKSPMAVLWTIKDLVQDRTHGHGCGRVTERFHKQPRTKEHLRTKDGARDRVLKWIEVGTATPCCGPSLPQTASNCQSRARYTLQSRVAWYPK
jgi:hypothetical protein